MVDKSSERRKSLDTIKKKLRMLPKEKLPLVERLVDELEYMDGLLVELKEDIDRCGATELYENGRQSTRRQNPSLGSYHTTLKTYTYTITALLNVLRADTQGANKTAKSTVDADAEEFLSEAGVGK
jgi:hypothetical protein